MMFKKDIEKRLNSQIKRLNEVETRPDSTEKTLLKNQIIGYIEALKDVLG
ncbi:MAG: hypothetical protein WC998_03415 [Candidatus Paceibacterota bacterium]